jgi:hypothetical protein
MCGPCAFNAYCTGLESSQEQETFLGYVKTGDRWDQDRLAGISEMKAWVVAKLAKEDEIRVTDILDRLVFHAEGGKVLFPARITGVPRSPGVRFQ